MSMFVPVGRKLLGMMLAGGSALLLVACSGDGESQQSSSSASAASSSASAAHSTTAATSSNHSSPVSEPSTSADIPAGAPVTMGDPSGIALLKSAPEWLVGSYLFDGGRITIEPDANVTIIGPGSVHRQYLLSSVNGTSAQATMTAQPLVINGSPATEGTQTELLLTGGEIQVPSLSLKACREGASCGS